MSKLRQAEKYLYRYNDDCEKLESLRGRLEYLEHHGDLPSRLLKEAPGTERIRKGAEDWYISCESVRTRIKEIQWRLTKIGELRIYMQESWRYSLRYALMRDILEIVYIERKKFAIFISEREISERTAYRRRNELLEIACEFMGL